MIPPQYKNPMTILHLLLILVDVIFSVQWKGDRKFFLKALGQEAEKIPTIVNPLIVANIRSYGRSKQSIHFKDNPINQIAKYCKKPCHIVKAGPCVLTHCLNYVNAASPERGGRKGREKPYPLAYQNYARILWFSLNLSLIAPSSRRWPNCERRRIGHF